MAIIILLHRDGEGHSSGEKPRGVEVAQEWRVVNVTRMPVHGRGAQVGGIGWRAVCHGYRDAGPRREHDQANNVRAHLRKHEAYSVIRYSHAENQIAGRIMHCLA